MVSLSKIVTRARKKELGDWHKSVSKERDEAKMQLAPREVHDKVHEYDREK